VLESAGDVPVGGGRESGNEGGEPILRGGRGELGMMGTRGTSKRIEGPNPVNTRGKGEKLGESHGRQTRLERVHVRER